MRHAAIAIAVAVTGCGSGSSSTAPAAGSAAARTAAGQQREESPHGGTPDKPARSPVPQFPLPDALKQPPPDALKSPEGDLYVKLVTNDAGTPAHRNDMVLVNYTGWRLPSGDTFFTTRTAGQPMPVSLAQPTPGFTDALLQLKKGEKAYVWVPPEVGYKDKKMPAKPDTIAYEVEVVDVSTAPAVPADVAAPPAKAPMLAPANVPYELLHAGNGSASPRPWDTVAFVATAWDATGRMLETTAMRKLAAESEPFRQPRVVQLVMSAMSPGEHLRFWTDATNLMLDGRTMNGVPKGTVCYDLELRSVVRAKADPPATPPDVAKVPADAKSTPLGVYYKVLASGAANAAHPGAKDMVRLQFTGWRSDGTMFETTAITRGGKPLDVGVANGPAGWSDVLQAMVVGDHWRVWIPSDLAYKGAPGRPQGTLVYDLELLAVTPKS